jgi:2-iminobutanoate/2-iminopropanoate deaminase
MKGFAMPRQTFSNVTSNLPYSPAVRAGDMVFIAGQVATDSQGNLVGSQITEQTHQVLKNCQAALALAGASFDDVVKVNVYLTDVNYFATMNEVYRQYFPESPPTRTTVGTPLARLGLLIEIDMIAYAPQ